MVYGLIQLTQAGLPVLLYVLYKNSILSTLQRNTVYKWSWYIMVYGGLAVFGPVALLWPLSYAGNFGETYVAVYDFFSVMGLVLNIAVSLMLWYASRMYLYEGSVSFTVVEYEFVFYMSAVWVVFWMLKLAFKREFYSFYRPVTTDVVAL